MSIAARWHRTGQVADPQPVSSAMALIPTTGTTFLVIVAGFFSPKFLKSAPLSESCPLRALAFQVVRIYILDITSRGDPACKGVNASLQSETHSRNYSMKAWIEMIAAEILIKLVHVCFVKITVSWNGPQIKNWKTVTTEMVGQVKTNMNSTTLAI